MRQGALPMMRKNPLPSYHPALTAPRSAVGSAFKDVCLNWSRPLVYSRRYQRQDNFILQQNTRQGEWNRIERTVCPKANTPCATAAARRRGCLCEVMAAIMVCGTCKKPVM